jgi:PAS domain S-box-containing protein
MPRHGRVISDGSSRIVHVNGGFTRMFGWRTEEVAGTCRLPCWLLSRPRPCAPYRSELRAGQPVGREEIVVGKHGQRYWAKVISNPILDADGRWQYTVSMLTDITRSKMHEALQHRVLEAMARERRWWRCWRWCAWRSRGLLRR